MLQFYRHKECAECGQIQEKLQELVLAHQVIFVADSLRLVEGTAPPLLRDGEKTFQGKPAILAHLEALENFKAQWDKYQSDSCYCGEDGSPE